MANKFKIGDEVKQAVEATSFNRWVARRGMSGQPLVVTGADAQYVYFFGDTCKSPDGWLHNRFIKVDPEPDYYVYPDTPVGTELVLTRSIKGLSRHYEIPKGATCILVSRKYFAKGCGRQVAFTGEFEKYGLCFVDCDSLMLKGYKVD